MWGAEGCSHLPTATLPGVGGGLELTGPRHVSSARATVPRTARLSMGLGTQARHHHHDRAVGHRACLSQALSRMCGSPCPPSSCAAQQGLF